jgi:AraC-like DNA-binding protein
MPSRTTAKSALSAGHELTGVPEPHELGSGKRTPEKTAAPGPSPHKQADIPKDMIRSNIVRELFATAGESGWLPADWCPAKYFDPGSGKPPVYLRREDACAIIHAAVERLPVPGLGLCVGMRQSIGHFGAVGLAMLSAPSFGEAITLGMRYAPVAGALLDLSIEHLSPEDHRTEPDVIVIVANLHSPDDILIEAFLCEELVASCINLCRGLLGPDFRPEWLELRQPRPNYADMLREQIGCDIAFDRGRNMIAISTDWMPRGMPAHHPDNVLQTLTLCQEQLPGREPDGHEDGNIVEMVESLLRNRLAAPPRLSEIAIALHMTERTLRRHLHAAHTSWRDIHDRLRCDFAESLLRKQNATVGDVGAAVGFSDTREFRRAFKRWTGTTPSSRLRQS